MDFGALRDSCGSRDGAMPTGYVLNPGVGLCGPLDSLVAGDSGRPCWESGTRSLSSIFQLGTLPESCPSCSVSNVKGAVWTRVESSSSW